ncbi:hypothetical protein LTR78_004245 [Recurvomyces mirabilis]|uniref:Uncharacterized protein n=1 Tax=Recurvomyces mirabilis TaxID=574656 RepID=A0AAE0WR00_9PEZI|nr:hypothetical protein LTR78_004245 [Recurvomyces mirabilis]KAK5153585.1 hypothetical protein LTS14_007279 [Recurvomyces mirabilis]
MTSSTDISLGLKYDSLALHGVQTDLLPPETKSTDATPPRATNPKAFRFFDLPRELRIQVYENLYQGYNILPGSDVQLPEIYNNTARNLKEWKCGRVKYASRLQLVDHQFRDEYLKVWAERHVHNAKINLNFWSHVRRAEPRDLAPPNQGRRTGKQLLSVSRIAEAVWLRLRDCLQTIETRFGVANRVRHVKLHDSVVYDTTCPDELREPLSLLRALPLPSMVAQLQRLDATLAHSSLSVELTILTTHPLKTFWGTLDYRRARRRVVMRQAHRFGDGGVTSRFEQEWICDGDVMEQWLERTEEEEEEEEEEDGEPAIREWVVVKA